MIRKIILCSIESFMNAYMKAHVKAVNGREHNILGVKVFCKYRASILIQEAFEKIQDYDEKLWDEFKSTVKTVAVADGNRDAWELITKGMVIVFSEDKSHMST